MSVRSSTSLPIGEDEIARLIGDGAVMLIRRALENRASEDKVQAAYRMFLSFYRSHMLDQTTLYPGVKETLEVLADCKMAVLTNKPYRSVALCWKASGVDQCFAVVYGGNSFEQKKPDPVGVLQILIDTSTAPEHAWMVGDSAVDVLTGRNAQVTDVRCYIWLRVAYLRGGPARLHDPHVSRVGVAGSGYGFACTLRTALAVPG